MFALILFALAVVCPLRGSNANGRISREQCLEMLRPTGFRIRSQDRFERQVTAYGKHLLRKRNPTLALQAMDTLLLHEPHALQSIGVKIEALIDLGRAEEALQLSNSRLAHDSTDKVAMGLRTQALLALGQRGEALQSAEELERLDPSNPIALGLKTQALLSLGRNSDALEVVEAQIALDPSNHVAYGLKIRALLALNLNKEALELAQAQAKVHSRDPIMLGLNIQALLVSGRCSEALILSERIISLFPEDFFAYLTRGLAAFRLGKTQIALESARMAVKTQPASNRSLEPLVLYLTVAGDSDPLAQASLQALPERDRDWVVRRVTLWRSQTLAPH